MTKKTLTINSFYRQSGGTSSNFNVYLPFAITGIKKIKLLAVHLFNSIYNISSDYSNNKLDFADGGGTYALTITNGAYDIPTLCSTIQTGMNGLSGTVVYTVNYSSTTYKITISGTGNFSLLWNSGTNTLLNCHSVLGFNQTDLTATNTYTGQNVYDLYIFKNIFITSGALASIGNTVQTNSNYTFVIPIDVPSGSLIDYSNNNHFEQIIEYLSPITLFNIDILLKGNSTTNLNFNNINWTIIFELDGEFK